MTYNPSGCAISGIINKAGSPIGGQMILESISAMKDRATNLGSGFAAYGLYPDFKDHYAFHILFESQRAKDLTEEYIRDNFWIGREEILPTKKMRGLPDTPLFWRYFVTPKESVLVEKYMQGLEDDFTLNQVMYINTSIEGAFVFSSGKNMGVFKGVGYPWDIGEFFRIDEYKGHIWIAHARFPTNTPGWWGGAHPFTILEWAIVHNGDITSYGTNRRFLEMHGYRCVLQTDTEVIAYMIDFLIRKNRLPIEIACSIIAPPFWEEIDRMDKGQRRVYETLRLTYPSALLNGPFSIIIANGDVIIGLNDRVKLRPMVAAYWGDYVCIASEESAIRKICQDPDRIWLPKGGEPIIARLDKKRSKLRR